MGTNCHISVKTADDEKNLTLMNAADIRFTQSDKELREILGIPNRNEDGFWEHLEQDDYQRVLDAALVHRESLTKERDALHEASSHVFGVAAHDLGIDILTNDIARTEEWISYYEIAAAFVKLGHHVTCYGC
jgi:hypothetical protein